MGMAQPGRGGGRGPGPNVEGDRWGKRALPPPPPGTGGPAMSNLPALHKTDNKFKVGHAMLLLLLLLQFFVSNWTGFSSWLAACTAENRQQALA